VTILATLWVALLYISPQTAKKIISLHQITPDEVRDAVQLRAGLDFSMEKDPDRGLRAIVKARIRGNLSYIVLYPAPDPFGEAWHLGSAYFVES
jgi:hypothetical protein